MTTPDTMLQSVFGYDQFRPQQRPIIDNILAKRDTLVILPTGGGKSLCYQLPALIFDGLTVVVSPLIALMQDQVTQLQQLGVAAAALNSSLDPNMYRQTVQQARDGQLKLLYMAPETLLRHETLVLLDSCRIACIAVDEAHCISSWGHDFRPEYRQLVGLRQRFRSAVWVALTATATERVREDIRQTLGFATEDSFIGSFDRPNLFINVQPKQGVTQQIKRFLISRRGQSGIIYCGTRNSAETLANKLQQRGHNARPYHAGLDAETRRRNQAAFVRDDVHIIVATVAFGMGIDKPDVRFVLHTYLPKNIESYYQQVGRAGRDGLAADCVLYFDYSDVQRQRRHIDEGSEHERQGRTARLEAMVDFAESRSCRRHQLLAYFNEIDPPSSCEKCDNCTQPQAEQVDISTPAQKFLACVYRTGQRFGAAHVIKVLRGSREQAILRQGHDRLSTYNIGADWSNEQWKHLARQLIDQRLLQRDMQFGSLTLTDTGIAALKGEKPVLGTLMTVGPTIISGDVPQGEYEVALFELLRSERKRLADEANVPPYTVFSNRSLIEMATYLPHTEADMSQIHGVGARKLTQYADRFLPLIRAYCQAHGLSAKPRVVAKPAVAAGQTQTSTHAYDAELFERLRVKRRALATGEGIPPFAVVNDRTLIELATFLPQDEESFLEIHGIGEHKLAKYAHDFLPIIRAFSAETDRPTLPRGAGVAMPSREEVADLFADGQAIASIADRFNITRGLVISFLGSFVVRGGSLDPAALMAESRLTPDDQRTVLRALAADEKHLVRPVFEQFKGRYKYEEIALLRSAFLRQRAALENL